MDAGRGHQAKLNHGVSIYLKPIRILVDSFADAGLPNAQMGNAREIVSRLDPNCFHVSMFVRGQADDRIATRPNTRLIRLPARRQTPRILREFFWGSHQILFYMKSSPAARWYLSARRKWKDERIAIGTVESQSDLKNEPSIASEQIRLWEQTILRCDRLYSNSRSVQASLEREYGLASEIIPTGVDTCFFTPDNQLRRDQRLRVLFAGSLRTYKRPHLVVDAAARFPEADFRIAGEGPLAAELGSRAEAKGVKNLELLGALSAEKLRKEYQNADIFLFPSTWEGSPKVILEAAACGLPVIARSSYSPETVLEGVTGYQAWSEENIFAHLEKLIQNTDLRRELGLNGRCLSEKYDWGVIAAQWEEAFVQAVSRSELRRAS
ncbi:MAG TPA: glycosyltransferase family 4 protein [Terriglobales bacterium]|nr:glycosyltransferase family 4 protein [Terriglobales bacterium]